MCLCCAFDYSVTIAVIPPIQIETTITAHENRQQKPKRIHIIVMVQNENK
jgi:hypothetical protein